MNFLLILFLLSTSVFAQRSIPPGKYDPDFLELNLNWRSISEMSDTALLRLIIKDQNEQIREMYRENFISLAQLELIKIKEFSCLQYTNFKEYRECIIKK